MYFFTGSQWREQRKRKLTDCDGMCAHVQLLLCRVRKLLTEALQLPADWFDQYFKQPLEHLRLLHYLDVKSSVEDGVFGCGAHSDWGWATYDTTPTHPTAPNTYPPSLGCLAVPPVSLKVCTDLFWPQACMVKHEFIAGQAHCKMTVGVFRALTPGQPAVRLLAQHVLLFDKVLIGLTASSAFPVCSLPFQFDGSAG